MVSFSTSLFKPQAQAPHRMCKHIAYGPYFLHYDFNPCLIYIQLITDKSFFNAPHRQVLGKAYVLLNAAIELMNVHGSTELLSVS